MKTSGASVGTRMGGFLGEPRDKGGPAARGISGIWKSFGPIRALRGVSMDIMPGETLGLLADNAAGKSTLMKVLTGVYQPDQGQIRVGGEVVVLDRPSESRQRGIEMICQDFALAENLDSRANIFLGRELGYAGKIEGQYLVDAMPEGGNVIYLVGQYGGASAECRKSGFNAVIKDHPNLKVVTELQEHGSRAEAKSIMENLLQKYAKGQVQALVAQNDEAALGASSAIQAASRLGEFKVLIGVDGPKPALDAITAGMLTATVFQDAIGPGTQAMTIASKILAGEAVDPQCVIPFKLVTKDNAASFR